MIKITLNSKYLKIFFLLFIFLLFQSKSYSQCAGNDNSITICNKETYNQGIGNPNGILNLYSLLGGTPISGGTWTDLNSSGGLNTASGLLNTWQINQGGVYNYRYVKTGVPGCIDNNAIITLTLGGFPGVNNPNAVACSDNSSIPLFSFLGSNPNPHFSGTWAGGPPGAVSGNFFNAQAAGVGTFVLTYTVPAVGSCPSRSADVTITVHPLPKAGTPVPLTFCETDDFSGYTNLDLYDQLTGEDNGGFWVDSNGTGEISGPGDSFINIQNIATNFGPGTYNFAYNINPSHPICSPASANVTITITPVVNLNGATLNIAPDICFNDIATTPIIGTITQGVNPIANGTYNITYVLSGANAGSAIVPVTFSGGTATFTINAAFLTASGNTTVNITTVMDPSTTLNCTRTISNLTDSFIINENPNFSDSQLNINNICLGQNAQGQISDISGPAIQLSNGTYNITFNVTGPNGTTTGQTSTITINGGNGVFPIPSSLTPGAGNYSLIITNVVNSSTNCSSTANLSASFTVSPIPDAVTIAITINDVCDGDAVIVAISGANNLSNGLYNITYDVNGAINASNQIASNVNFTSGSGSFTLPSGILNIGASSLTITNLFNTTSTCQTTTFTSPTDAFEIHAIPNASEMNISVNNVCLGQSGTVNMFDINIGVAPELTNGAYTITYDITGANTVSGQSVIANITNGTGTFAIPSSQLTNTGASTITIVIITNNTTGCNATGVPISTNFNVLENPIINNVSLSVSQPICQGQNGTASITGATLINGNYDLSYNITGANTVTGQMVSVVFAGGNTTFNIPTTQIPNVGNYTINITNIVNNNTPNACNSPVTNVTTTFVVSENPNTNNTTLTALNPVCLGTNGQITLTDATGTLSNGNYNLVYNLSGANTATNNTANVTISSGTGSFSVPASLLTNTGNTTVTIISIANSTTNCSSAANLIIAFDVIPLPDTAGATLAVSEPICLGNNGSAQINGPALTNGSYTLTYDLTGSNSSIGNSSTVIISASNGSFTIPSTLLTNSGNTSVLITLLINNTTGCIVQGLSISDNFIVSPIPAINISQTSISDICIGNDAVVSINSPAGLINGNYQLNYTISGANGPSNQTATFTVAGGVASFTISNTLLTNSGSTSIFFTSITNLGTTCNSPLNFNVTFMVNPLPNVNPNQFIINDICLGQSGTGTISNATNLVNSNYTIVYNLTGANTANNQSATIPIATGGGSFAIPASLLINSGITTLTIVSITDNTSGCTTSPISISDSFLINPIPNTVGTTVTVTEPICLGNTATVQINGLALPDGSYTLSYDLSGTNSSTANIATVVIASSTGSFTIPNTLLTNAGNTIVTIILQNNNTTGCTVQGPGVSDNFTVSPMPGLTASQTSISDICIGNNAVVSINSPIGLINGNYQLNYTISGANGPSNQTATFTVAGGMASFTILNTLLTNSGSTSIVFNSITNLGTTCSSPLNFNVTFMVNPLPNVNPNQFIINDICLGQSGTGTISNATNLANSNYTIQYNLTGANTVNNQSAIISIATEGGSFAIPASLLTNSGTTTLTISSITNNSTGCTSNPIVITDVFNVNPLPNTTGTTVTVTEPICLGNGTIATLSSPLLADGTYNVNYAITGANTASGNTTVTLLSGNGTFIIQSADLVNAGNYTISIASITNLTTVCIGTSSLITDNFVVNPTPNILVSEVTIANICLGNAATASIASVGGLTDGNYSLTYSILGSNGPATQTVPITILGGNGNFTIPSSLLTNSGVTSVKIAAISNTATSCTKTFTNLQVDFNINPIPTVNAGEMAVADTCSGQNASGSISSAANLTNGNYTFTYNLTGANAASNQTASLTVNGGNGTFGIPSTIIPNIGSTTLTITGITNTSTGCSTSGLSVSDGFTVIALPDITGADINTSNICINSNAEVFITNATALTNGNYTIIYNLSGANTSVNNSVSIPFNSGTSSFIIPPAQLPNGGVTTVTIQSFIYNISQCGANTIALNPINFTITDPQTPTLISDGNLFCIQDKPTIGNLTSNASGTGALTWYNAPSGGSAYTATDLLVNGFTYYATATDAINGCQSGTRLEVTVDLTACGDLFIPDGFSPNGDGLNEEFYIKDIEVLYPKFELEIYNRYGSMVYKGNTNTARFNGKANQSTVIGKDILPTGVYFYILYFKDVNNTKPVQGRLYLSR